MDPSEYLPVIHNRVRSDIYGNHYVRSASDPDKHYIVKDGVCNCKGFEYRQRCSHLDLLIFLDLIHPAEIDVYRWGGDSPPVTTRDPRTDLNNYPIWTSHYRHPFVLLGKMYPTRAGGFVPDDLPYKMKAVVPAIVPTPDIMMLTTGEQREAYRHHLDARGVDVIQRGISRVQAQARGMPIVLLSYNDMFSKNQLYDIRRVFADWWEERTGEVVPEIQYAEPNVQEGELPTIGTPDETSKGHQDQ